MEYQKTVETTSDLIDNKITKVLQNSEQNNSETATNKHDKEKLKERYIYIYIYIYISPGERQKNIDNLVLNIIVQ